MNNVFVAGSRIATEPGLRCTVVLFHTKQLFFVQQKFNTLCCFVFFAALCETAQVSDTTKMP